MKTSDATKSLLHLVKAGQLYALRDVMESEGQANDLTDDEWESLLDAAVESGFHSMVELLLCARTWSAEELSRSLNRSLWNARLDLAELLLAAGAPVAEIDFADVCQTMKSEVMKRFLRAGVEP